MAALAGDLSKQILGHSESTKAFRPWWDNIEDQILYGFVLTGKLKKIREITTCILCLRQFHIKKLIDIFFNY